MGKIELDHTGSGGGVTLSSDGTDLLLDGTAIGGGADLYAANESSPSAQPSATGTNAIAIGDRATASGNKSIALGWGQSQGLYSMSGPIGNYLSTYGAIADYSLAIGSDAKASGSYGVALGRSVVASGAQSLSLGFGGTASATNAIAIGDSNTASHANAIVIGDSVQSTTTNEVSIGGTADTVRISESYTLPTSDGTANQVLTTDGSGAVTFADAGGGSPDLYAESYDGTTTLPSATGNNAVALGALSTSSGAISFSFGNSSAASGANSIALGRNAKATNSYSFATGNSYSSGTASIAMGITNNTASYGATGANSIAIGRLSKASGADSFAIGDNNIVANGDAFALGNTNNVGGGGTAFAIGTNHTVSGTLSACIGGSTSTASQTYAMTFGPYAKAAVQNAFIFGSKGWFSAGSAQGGMYILYADTTDATPEVLTTTNSAAGSTNQIVAASDTCITFDGTITAMQNGAQAYASWKIEGLLVNDGGTTTLANSATTVIQNLSSWGMALSADNTNNALAITVTGEAAHNIRWVANIRTTEVTYA